MHYLKSDIATLEDFTGHTILSRIKLTMKLMQDVTVLYPSE